MSRRIGAVAALLAAVTLGGCSTWDQMSRRDKDTAVGAAVGGATGAAVSGGGALGTLGGAAVGGVIGNQVGREREERR